MNILKSLRKPYFAMFLSTLILFISCEQSSLNNPDNAFDYSLHNEFIKGHSVNNNGSVFLKNGNSNTIDEAKVRLQNINTEYGTDIMFPNEFLGLTDYDPAYIENTALTKGWLNQNDIFLMDEFESDLQKSDFNTALQNFENNVLTLGLSSQELMAKNIAANSLKSLNHYNPDVFAVTTNGGGWGCVRAVAALVLSSVALASCAAVLPCGLAVTAWILSYATYVANCKN
tara:strand:- start:361 stop:1047 length:687 start_codon:yes stop_codon:yes gene_type:complete